MGVYYPFGMVMPGRSYSSQTSYRYGFNKKENDTEYGSGGLTQDYGFRMYNPAIAKFLSVDPLATKYPWYTSYQFAGNMPIWAIDLDGSEEKIVTKDANQNVISVLRMCDYRLTEWLSFQESIYGSISPSRWNENGYKWKSGYDSYTLSMPSESKKAVDSYVGPGKGTLTIELNQTGGIGYITYDPKDVEDINGSKPIPLSESIKEGVGCFFRTFIFETNNSQIKAMRSSLKKSLLVVGMALSAGSLSIAVAGGEASAGTYAIYTIDTGFTLDDLTADENGLTLLSRRLSPESLKYFNSLKLAFSVYTRQMSTVETLNDPDSQTKFLNWVIENYKVVDGALQMKNG